MVWDGGFLESVRALYIQVRMRTLHYLISMLYNYPVRHEETTSATQSAVPESGFLKLVRHSSYNNSICLDSVRLSLLPVEIIFGLQPISQTESRRPD